MATTIAVVNQKGGVGKTTTTFNLWAALRARGCSVLMVDLDPQAALSLHFGLNPPALSRTIYDVLIGTYDVYAVILYHSGTLGIAPANIDLVGAEMELVHEIGREHILREKLHPIKADYILIDCPPSLGLLTVNALCAADYVLIPVQTQPFAYAGMSLLFESIAKVQRRANPTLRVLGILPTLYDGRRTVDKEVLATLQKDHSLHLLPVVIPQRVALVDASTAQRSILEHDPKSDVAQAFIQLAEVIDGKA